MPHPIYTTENPDGRFISGVFEDQDEAHAYAKAHGHQVGFHHTDFPLYYIESSRFPEHAGWAREDSLDTYLDAFAEDEPEDASSDEDFALVTVFDGPWTPPEGHEGTDYMGTLEHHHLTWGDLDRYKAGESVRAVLGIDPSGIQQAESWWYNAVEAPTEDWYGQDPEDPDPDPLTRPDVRRFIATLINRYIDSEPLGDTGDGLLTILAEVRNLRGDYE